MPRYRLDWTLDNGKGQEPSTHSAEATASTVEKAVEKITSTVISPEEVDGYTLTWAELDEDGEVVTTGP